MHPAAVLSAAAATALSSIILSCMVVYFCFYCFDCYRSFSNLKQLPYNKFRMANMALRLQVRQLAPQRVQSLDWRQTMLPHDTEKGTLLRRCASGRLASSSSPSTPSSTST